MALIICKQCGKSISDTTSHCIHCGAPTAEPTADIVLPEDLEEKAQSDLCEDESKEDNAVVDFSDLDEEEKAALQLEFWKEDKRARNYIRKELSLWPYFFLTVLSLVGGRWLPRLQSWALNNFFGGTVYKYEWLDLAEVFLDAIHILWIVSVVFTLYNAITHRSRLNRQVYHKRMQLWLLKNKGIHFMPNFISQKDKEVFDKINLDS
ncbi:MAG: hypothetical protein IKA64_06895 [Clostridia bacterium]|nr:hypothetical protein [Clostridia bacterium]